MNADLMVLSGTSYPELADLIGKRLGKKLGNSQVLSFSNENLMARIKDNVREKDVSLIQTHAVRSTKRSSKPCCFWMP